MLSNQGRVLTKARLLRAVWGLAYADESAYLHVYVNRLRRKLCGRAPAGARRGPDRNGARHRLPRRRPRVAVAQVTRSLVRRRPPTAPARTNHDAMPPAIATPPAPAKKIVGPTEP